MEGVCPFWAMGHAFNAVERSVVVEWNTKDTWLPLGNKRLVSSGLGSWKKGRPPPKDQVLQTNIPQGISKRQVTVLMGSPETNNPSICSRCRGMLFLHQKETTCLRKRFVSDQIPSELHGLRAKQRDLVCGLNFRYTRPQATCRVRTQTRNTFAGQLATSGDIVALELFLFASVSLVDMCAQRSNSQL